MVKNFVSPARSAMIAAGLLCSVAPAVRADQLINDDLVVTNSLCVGTDCANGESFSFDTIRLKENNLRIKFDDTSNSSSFPSNDWQLTANDSANGGLNRFSIDDITSGRTPFTVEAGAPGNALYVESDGDVGLGTSNPAVDLHILNGNTPTLRLDQDGTSGFTPQIWDVAGNETNFFVRDVTNGSRLPFKIQPSAPNNALYVASDGDVGLGTASPTATAQLDVVSDELIAAIFRGTGTKVVDVKSTDNGAVQIRMQTDSTNRRFVALNSAGSPQSQVIFGNNEIKFAGVNDTSALFATVNASGIVTNIGSCTSANPCDAAFDPEIYEVPSIDAHAASMWENRYLPAIGPTANGPVNVNEKIAGMINELEHAHIYIDQLNQRITALETQLDAE